MNKRAILDDLREQIATFEAGGASKGSKKTIESPLSSQEAGSPSCSPDHSIADSSKPLDAKHCLSQAIASLNASDQPILKIRKKLLGKGYPDSVVDETIEKLVSLGYLDDTRYAEVFIRSKLAQGKGIQGIIRDLRVQGIDVDSLQPLLDELTEDEPTEFERAYAFLVHHPPRSKNLREGAYRKLASRGFSSDAASRAARKWSAEQENA